ncbi:alpha/beta fold hydrolase [Roseofilum reptotaenium CS-1145]|uniref:Esterase n=1 Tax=Roseofilum reptotaenium AO1-A TaxID=1925591 RepID=A0A1L9QQH7_9CYAN|nr:YqiA/YcfP family alpha/beta fold hydrolase [Roseofilum reptotaenium]MDB9516580.1 alpha/beta fold hydrolase [Roseofilum reptotaenium CS-1145]OJJ24899.1 esterase [Roseofilum reptotaenium AO1-A]
MVFPLPREALYLYLHGFASSPQSLKSLAIAQKFSDRQITLQVPDLNQGDFSHLTLTRQLQQVGELFPASETPVYIIGSSFGGLTATWLAERYPQVQALVLLAPAFEFYTYWMTQLTESERQEWQKRGYWPIYHYGQKRSLSLHYRFISDLRQYSSSSLTRAVPTLIFHGLHDEVIPLKVSRDYAENRPWVNLIELESDHSLGDQLPEIWQGIRDFLPGITTLN